MEAKIFNPNAETSYANGYICGMDATFRVTLPRFQIKRKILNGKLKKLCA
jgi:hypothetical protein